SGAGSKIIEGNISEAQVLSMLRTPLEHLEREIARCFDYFSEVSGVGKIESLVLFGGGASLAGLTKYLSDALGIEVTLGDPLRLELAVGAALSEGKGINLLPPEIKEETTRTLKRSGIAAAAAGVTLILAFTYSGMRIHLNNLQKNISAARMELSSLQPQLKQIEVESLLSDEPYWEDVFKELSNIIPADICLTELSMENHTMRMRGIVTSKEAEESLSVFIRALGKGVFKNVKLVTSKQIKERAVNGFELTCLVD
ncbi:MAG: PilN domain-containing protein, partial [Candidatus Omnitrophota bacterium]